MTTADLPLLSADDAARLLDLTPRAVARLAKRGTIPCVVLPDGEPRFVRTDLAAWVDSLRKTERSAS